MQAVTTAAERTAWAAENQGASPPRQAIANHTAANQNSPTETRIMVPSKHRAEARQPEHGRHQGRPRERLDEHTPHVLPETATAPADAQLQPRGRRDGQRRMAEKGRGPSPGIAPANQFRVIDDGRLGQSEQHHGRGDPRPRPRER